MFNIPSTPFSFVQISFLILVLFLFFSDLYCLIIAALNFPLRAYAQGEDVSMPMLCHTEMYVLCEEGLVT